MTQLSREQLLEIVETDHVQCGEASAMAKMLLAAEAQEPVAWAHRLVNKRNGVIHPWVYGSAETSPSEGDVFHIEVMPLYAAPQPVAVPDDLSNKSFEYIANKFQVSMSDAQWILIGWNACRAAMLQSLSTIHSAPTLDSLTKNSESVNSMLNAEPVKTGLTLREGLAERDALNEPDCWCRTCRSTDMRFVVCPDCGNKRCPHANDHRNACTGSNEPGQEGSAYQAAPQEPTK